MGGVLHFTWHDRLSIPLRLAHLGQGFPLCRASKTIKLQWQHSHWPEMREPGLESATCECSTREARHQPPWVPIWH